MDKVYFSLNDILLIFISFFFPPISVFLKSGCGKDFLINLILTTLTFVFGVFHAIYIIAKSNDEEYTRLNNEQNNDGNVTGIPDNAIVVILPGANVNTNNSIPSNLPPPSYAESEQIAKEQKEFLYPDLPTYEATTSTSDNVNGNQTDEKH